MDDSQNRTRPRSQLCLLPLKGREGWRSPTGVNREMISCGSTEEEEEDLLRQIFFVRSSVSLSR